MKTKVVATTCQLFKFCDVFKPHHMCPCHHSVASPQAADVDGFYVWEMAATI